MRTIPIPPVVLGLLMPLFALAQPGLGSDNHQAATSPLTWFWVAVMAIAVVAFIWSTIVISRRRGTGGPTSGPRIS